MLWDKSKNTYPNVTANVMVEKYSTKQMQYPASVFFVLIDNIKEKDHFYLAAVFK